MENKSHKCKTFLHSKTFSCLLIYLFLLFLLPACVVEDSHKPNEVETNPTDNDQPTFSPTSETILDDDGNGSIATSLDGGFYVHGARLLKFKNSGEYDNNFGTNGVIDFPENCNGKTLKVDSDNNLYIVGSIRRSSTPSLVGGTDMKVCKILPSGEADINFGDNGIFSHPGVTHDTAIEGGNDIAITSSGNIYVIGSTFYIDDTDINNKIRIEKEVLWRYTKEGVLDTSFGDGNGYIFVGNPSNSGGIYDESLGTNFINASLESIDIDMHGDLVISGWAHATTAFRSGTDYDRIDIPVVWKYAANGVLDSSFGGGKGYQLIYHDNDDDTATMDFKISEAQALADDGSIYIVGYKSDFTNDYKYSLMIWKINTDGELDLNFGDGKGYAEFVSSTDFRNRWNHIALSNSGTIYVTGVVNSRAAVIKYSENGILDTNFLANGGGYYVDPNNSSVTSEGLAIAFSEDQSTIFVTGRTINGGDKDLVVWTMNK